MKLTDIFKFKLFERTDPVDMETVNENFESVEKIFDGLTAEDVGAVATKGNTADNTVAFTTASERTKISSGETHATLFGKIARWIADLKTVAFSGSYNDLSNKPTIPTVVNNNTTTEAGYALDARQANPNVAGSLGEKVNSLADTVSNIGTLYTVSNSSITVGTSNTLLTSKSLPAGTYVVVGEFYIPSGYSGELNCVLTTASAAGSTFATTRIHKSSTSGSVRIQTTGVIKLVTTTNVCVAGKTTTSVSGCEGVLRATRIK